MADGQSIWKKEIRLRRKPDASEPEAPRPKTPEPARGARVPPAPEPPAKPESVADLLRPLADGAVDPIVLPPVTPSPSSPPLVLPPVSNDEPPGAAESAEEPDSVGPVGDGPAAIEETAIGPVVVPELPPAVEAPPLQPPPERQTRRSRKHAEKEARRLQAEERKRQEHETKAAQKAAKAEGKRNRTGNRRAAKKARRADAGHKRLVGLKIGASQIAAAQIVNSSGPRVVRMARAPLERGVVVGGELREPEALASALKTFFRKNKLPRNAVRLGIANNRIGVRTFEISGIDDPKQLANAIRFRAQETMPIPLDEAVLDYRILDENVGADGVLTRRVLLVVAHRELVDRYVTACRKAGLKLVGIDLEAFALLRALGDPAEPVAAEDAGLVCISIGHDRSTLAVSDGRVCEFTRVLPWGGSALDVAVARVLDLTPSEAQPLKHELAIGDEGEAAGLDARSADAARRAMAAELQVFARELVASLRFYQEQPGSLGIGEILLTGGGAQCGGLVDELQQLMGVTVRLADPLGRVKVPRKLRKLQSASGGSLAVAVGLGIED